MRCSTDSPGGRGDGELRHRAREEAVDRNVAACLDCGIRQLGLFLGPEPRGVLVEAFDLRRVRWWRQAREAVVGRCAPSSGAGAFGDLGEPVRIDLVRRRDADSSVLHHTERDHRVLDQRRLVHLRAGEAREPGVLDVRNGLRFAVDDLERGVRHVDRVHERTPTCTFRNRAGAAPCETCAL